MEELEQFAFFAAAIPIFALFFTIHWIVLNPSSPLRKKILIVLINELAIVFGTAIFSSINGQIKVFDLILLPIFGSALIGLFFGFIFFVFSGIYWLRVISTVLLLTYLFFAYSYLFSDKAGIVGAFVGFLFGTGIAVWHSKTRSKALADLEHPERFKYFWGQEVFYDSIRAFWGFDKIVPSQVFTSSGQLQERFEKVNYLRLNRVLTQFLIVSIFVIPIGIKLAGVGNSYPEPGYLTPPAEEVGAKKAIDPSWHNDPRKIVEAVNREFGINTEIEEGNFSHSWRDKNGENKRSKGYYVAFYPDTEEVMTDYKKAIEDFLIQEGFSKNYYNTTKEPKTREEKLSRNWNTVGYERDRLQCSLYLESRYVTFGCGLSQAAPSPTLSPVLTDTSNQKISALYQLPKIDDSEKWQIYKYESDITGLVSFKYPPNYTIQSVHGSSNPNWLEVYNPEGKTVIGISQGMVDSKTSLSQRLDSIDSFIISENTAKGKNLTLEHEYKFNFNNFEGLLRIFNNGVGDGYEEAIAYIGQDKRFIYYPNKVMIEFRGYYDTVGKSNIVEKMMGSLIVDQYLPSGDIVNAIAKDLVGNSIGLKIIVMANNNDTALGYFTGSVNESWIAKKIKDKWKVIWLGNKAKRVNYPTCRITEEHNIVDRIKLGLDCGDIKDYKGNIINDTEVP